MRVSIVAGVVAVVAVVAGGAYYGLEVYPQQAFRAGLDQTLRTLPPGTTATYQDAHYAPVSREATVTGVTVHGLIPGDPPVPFDITIDSLQTTGPNLDFAAAWAKAAANPAAAVPDAALPVADSVTLKGVTFHSVPVNVTEASAVVSKPRLYPWALLHEGMPNWKDLQASMAPRTGPPALADLQPLLRAEAAAMLGIAYDNYEGGPAKVTETLPGIDVAWSVKKTAGGGFDRGVMKGGTIEGITVNGNQIGTFSVDRVTLSAADMREPMTRIVNGETLSPILLNGINIGRIEYVGITVQLPGQPVTQIGGFSIGPMVFTQGLPVSGALGWTDVHVARSQLPDGEAKDAFGKLNLDAITMSFAVSYEWDVAKQSASVHDTVLKVNELGTLTFSADLTNVTPNVATMNQAKLAHAKLRLDDASLVDRLLRAGAAQSGMDPAAFRQQIATMVQLQSVVLGGDSPIIAAAGQSASSFIASPHSLTIVLAPPAPVAIMSLAGAAAKPAALAATVGLTVTANQP
jgi:hypothetical protein